MKATVWPARWICTEISGPNWLTVWPGCRILESLQHRGERDDQSGNDVDRGDDRGLFGSCGRRGEPGTPAHVQRDRNTDRILHHQPGLRGARPQVDQGRSRMIPALIFGIIVAVLAGLIYYFTEVKRVGGIRFWRLGRLGGSFYISRAPKQIPSDHAAAHVSTPTVILKT